MSKRSNKFLLYLLIPFIPLFLITLDQAIFRNMKMRVVEATSLPMRIVLFPINEIKKLLTYHSTYNDYMELKAEVEALRARLLGQEEIIKENQRYKTLLEFRNNLVYSTKAANVIGRDPDNWTATLLVDRGSRDGIKVGMPVISPNGVVGKIVETGNRVSKVMLLVDPSFSVAAIIQRSHQSGLVSGTLKSLCRLRYLDEDANVKIGDRVITSKISVSFPEGLLVGEIVEIFESQSSPTLECLVKPSVSFSQLEEVLIITR